MNVKDSDKVVIICVMCVVAIALLTFSVAVTYLNLERSNKKEYSLTFENSDITFEHDGITFVISSNNQAGNKIMSVSDLVGETVTKSYSIYASMFSSGRQYIDSADIKFDNQQALSFQTSYGRPTQIEISVAEPFSLGEYHGWFILPDPEGFTIPVKLSTPPLIAESMKIII